MSLLPCSSRSASSRSPMRRLRRRKARHPAPNGSRAKGIDPNMSPRLGRDEAAGGPVVQGFAGGGFSVDGGIYLSLLLTPNSADAWDSPALAELGIDHLTPLLELDPPPEFVLL